MEVSEGHLVRKLAALSRLPQPDIRRRIRRQAGASQIDVARECGVTREAVGRWEDGSRRPRGEHLLRYVACLDLMRQQADEK